MQNTSTSILGYKTTIELNLFCIGAPTGNTFTTNTHSLDQLLDDYTDRFRKLRQVKDVKIQIKVNPDRGGPRI